MVVKPRPLSHILAESGLWLDPVRWTARELKRISCRFKNVDPAYDDYQKDHNQTEDAQWTRLLTAVSPCLTELLAIHPDARKRLECMTEIMSFARPWQRGPFPDRRDGAPFFFQTQIFRHTASYSLFLDDRRTRHHPSKNPSREVGYVDYEEIKNLRVRRLKSRVRRSHHQKAFEKELAKATPPVWTRDPYIFFLLLAIAESRLRYNPNEKTQKSRLLVHNWKDDPNHIYLYEIEVTTDLINAVVSTGRTVSGVKRMIIFWKRVSLKPYDSFPQRLQDILLKPSLAADEPNGTSGNSARHTAKHSKDRSVEKDTRHQDKDTNPHSHESKHKRKVTGATDIVNGQGEGSNKSAGQQPTHSKRRKVEEGPPNPPNTPDKSHKRRKKKRKRKNKSNDRKK